MRILHHFSNWNDNKISLDWKVTKLFPLSPQGLGTAMIEGLTGYIARLATEHCMSSGRLFNEAFTPYLNKYYLNEISHKGGNGFYNSAHMINGISIAAEQFSTMLNELTGNHHLQKLTLQSWSKAVPQRGLLRKVKVWCPECYEEMRASPLKVVYDPLIWSIRAVSICRKHRLFLNGSCPKCGMTNLMIDRRSSPGFCSHCNAWLGASKVVKVEASDFEVFSKAKMIERLLESQFIPNKEGIAITLNRIVTQEHSNITNVARKLFVPKTTFWSWYKGVNLPPIDEVLRICNKYGINIIDFYSGSLNDDHAPVIYAIRKMKLNLRLTTRPLIEVKKLAENLVMDSTNGFLHVRAMSDVVGCNKKTLYNHFPYLCKMQSKKWKLYLHRRRCIRLKNIKQNIRSAIEYMALHGESPTIKNLEQYMGMPAMFREREVKNYFENLSNGEMTYSK